MSNATKMSARERINALVDANSFVEIGALVTKRSTDFNMQEQSVPGDGVITGYGLVDGSIVYVYSQDAAALGGSVGEMHAKKICRMYDMAIKAGAPVIGLIDCAGLRLEEQTDALAGFGSIYKKQAEATGLIPQISVILGTCGGGVAISSVLSDFTFMEKDAKLFVNSPNVIAGNYIEKCDTGSSEFQSTANTVDFVCEGEAETLTAVRDFIAILPANCEDMAVGECDDDLNRLVPEFAGDIDDPAKALADLSDSNVFFEVKSGYATEMVTGFIKLNGITIGAIANKDDKLTTAGCEKATEFVCYCEAFGIPILTLTNVTGYAATMDEEKTVAAAAAKLTAAFACAEVAKVNLITKNAFGSAYVAMNSKHIGADMEFAIEGSQVGTMDPKVAAKVMDTDYSADPMEAAKRGYVDFVIPAESARKQLLYAFEMLY